MYFQRMCDVVERRERKAAGELQSREAVKMLFYDYIKELIGKETWNEIELIEDKYSETDTPMCFYGYVDGVFPYCNGLRLL